MVNGPHHAHELEHMVERGQLRCGSTYGSRHAVASTDRSPALRESRSRDSGFGIRGSGFDTRFGVARRLGPFVGDLRRRNDPSETAHAFAAVFSLECTPAPGEQVGE